MKVFVAGASGALGRPLLRQLVAADHEVTGTTRSEVRAEGIRAAGAKAAIVDALDLRSRRFPGRRCAQAPLSWQPRWSSWRQGFREAPG